MKIGNKVREMSNVEYLSACIWRICLEAQQELPPDYLPKVNTREEIVREIWTVAQKQLNSLKSDGFFNVLSVRIMRHDALTLLV